jgi:hypothetical protein
MQGSAAETPMPETRINKHDMALVYNACVVRTTGVQRTRQETTLY